VVQIAPIPTSPRERREPSDKVVARKREIVAAASRVFRRLGLHDAGMREIAAELGMTASNLYYYFRDKEALLAFVQEETLGGLLDLAERVRSLDLPADGRLALLIEGHVLRLNEETPGSLAHLEVEALGEPRRKILQRRRDAYERACREIVEAGIAAGTFRPCDPKVAALAILGAVNWTVKWFRPGGGKTAREIGRECAELLVRGLLAPAVPFSPPWAVSDSHPDPSKRT
jgi:AcrR family transcriptional regulator